MTSDAPISVLEALKSREPIFHRPEFGTRREDFDRMIDAEFWEVGASGRVYSREIVLNELDKRHAGGPVAEDWEIEDCACRQLGAELFLFTYRLNQSGRLSRRATVWRLRDAEWTAVYHQGTLIHS